MRESFRIDTWVSLAILTSCSIGLLLPPPRALATPAKEEKPSAEAAQEGRTLPAQKQPQFGLARIEKDGWIVVLVKVTRCAEVHRMLPDGEKVKDVVEHVPFVCVRTSRLKSKEAQVFVVAGKKPRKVAWKQLGDLLEKLTPVLITPPGEEIDPFYASFLREGTLIIVPPREARDPQRRE